MTSRFNFYDLLGYLVPGALMTLLMAYSMASLFGLESVSTGYISGIGVGATTIFLVFSYFVGHLMQASGRNLESKEKDRWGGYFSVQFLKPDNNHFSSDLKTAIKQAAFRCFGIQVELSDVGLQEQEKRYQEVFDLCYSLVIQKGVSQHTDIHNAIYGMFRGALVLWYVARVLLMAVVIRHTAVFVYGWFQQGAFPPQSLDLLWALLFSAALALFIFLSMGFLKDRLRHFGERFADSVYRNFFVYTCLK